MMSKQKILFIIIAALFLISLGINILKLMPETKNYSNYSAGLAEYNNEEYNEAYHSFGKVSRFSKIKSAAIYRQSLCADRLNDTDTEVKKYKELVRFYPNSELAIRAKYLKAQNYYENKNYKKAQKEFNNILNKYPSTNYATAANFYLGSIELEKFKTLENKSKKQKACKKTLQYFKTYLKKAPDGKFAVNSIGKLVSLGIKLNNEDYMLITRVYQTNDDFNEAQKYLKYTNFSVSWPYFVKNSYAMKNYAQVRYYTEEGLKNRNNNIILINEDYDDKIESENIYKAIDAYLKVSNNPKESISYLLSIASPKAKGLDYLLYKNCNNLAVNEQSACFNTLYYKYPDGQFAAEALSNIIYSKIRLQEYSQAKRLAKIHLSKFKDANSAPKVMFWLAKTSERMKNYEEARSYYKALINQYPDDYYAYHAFLNLNRFRKFNLLTLKQNKIEFPYKNSKYELITELVKVKDYGLLNQLYSENDFIKSWLLNQQGDFASSARIARDAMDKIKVKPNKYDLRWRLVYPIHYYDEIRQSARIWNNDPTLILSIIREESYFNPSAKSPVGARGLMQLMPATASEAAVRAGIILPNYNLLKDPYINIKLGNVYYSTLKRQLMNKDILAVLAYNGGIGSVSKWKQNLIYEDTDDFIEQIPYPETQNYLKKVYRSYWNYIRIYDGVKF